MSYVVRKVGGGTFNPNAICFSPDERYLFVACGSQINIYSLPDLTETDTIISHNSHISCLACDNDHLISSDCSGNILWHKFNDLTILDKNPINSFQCENPIEKILIRNNRLFYIYFKHRLFWVEEYNNSECIFNISTEVQSSFIKKLHPGLILNGINPFRFVCLDAFDINNECNSICVGDRFKLHIHNFETNTRKTIPNPKNVMICRFRNNGDVISILANGMLFIHGNHPDIRDHWHFICPNSLAFNNTFIYTGGFEGVLTILNDKTHRHEFLPRLGITIEGLSLSYQSSYLAAVIDKNILALIDPASKVVREYITNIVEDVSFFNNIIMSLRKPNLIQFFDSKTSKIIEQLQVSSYNSVIPITSLEINEKFLVTIETSGFKSQPSLTLRGQVSLNHKRPRANKPAHDYAYEKLLFHDKYSEMKGIQKLKMKTDENIDEIIYQDFSKIELEGNPLVKDKDASNSVLYSEIKIWTRIDNKFVIDQSFRIIGKFVSCLSMHPNLDLFTIIVSHELQIWKRTERDMWEMFKSTKLSIIPNNIKWSPDGTILILLYDRFIDIFDSEKLKSLEIYYPKSQLISIFFYSDYEIILHTKVGISIFDLRTLIESKQIFAQTTLCSSKDKSISFVINKNNPIIILSEKNEMKSWILPTNCSIRALHLLKENDNSRIICIDQDNFIWSIDQYGLIEKSKPKNLTLTLPKPKNIQINKKTEEILINKIPEIQSLFNLTSHQILNIQNLSSALFDILLEQRSQKESSFVPIKLENFNNNMFEDIPLIEYSTKELLEMRNLL